MAQGAHLDHLDGWRGLAICLLLIGHFFPIPGIGFDALGVSLFFVLSGHLMAGLLFIKGTPLPIFYRRRISRVFPVHIAFISVVCGAFFMLDRTVNWAEVPIALFFVQNYFSGKSFSHTLPFGHIWSLAVEEQAYVILSIVAILARSKLVDDAKVLFILVLGCIAVGIWYSMHYAGAELDFGNWLRVEVSGYGILVSALLAVVFHRENIRQPSALAFFAIIATAVACQWWSVPAPVKTFVGVGMLALAVNLLSTAPPPVIKSILSWRPLRMMGVWSFSLYMWQQPFYAQITRNDWTSQALNLCVAMAVGVISFYVIEQPARQWLNQNWGT